MAKKTPAAEVPVPAPASVIEKLNRAITLHGGSPQLFERVVDANKEMLPLLKAMMTVEETEKQITNRKANPGIKIHPFNMQECLKFISANPTHAACITAKVSATTGMGFADGLKKTTEADGMTTKRLEESKVDKVLNPLCFGSWRSTLKAMTGDHWQTSICYLEVIRDANNKIAGLNHLPSFSVFLVVESNGFNYHYEVCADFTSSYETKYMANFGDKERFMSSNNGLGGADATKISEIIAIREPSSMSRWYGWLDWFSAVPQIELAQMNTQMKFDFYNNRGCPDLLVVISGSLLKPSEWLAIENSIGNTIGQGNQHKTVALNLADPSVKVDVTKLAADGATESDYAATADSTSLAIVTAHGVPPVLAGVQIPGKMGANNETVNALMAFELLKISPVQAIFEQTLGSTLGHPQKGVAGLGADDFRLVRLTEVMDMQAAGVASKQRTPAAADKRNPNANGGGMVDGLQQH